jgi:hypothetical protein
MLTEMLDWMIAYSYVFGEPVQHWVPTFGVAFVIALVILIWLDHRNFRKLKRRE